MDYASYLKLDQLLLLQQPMSPPGEHKNEHLFIITHQIHELWFKQLINEIHCLIDHIQAGEIPASIDELHRINAITRTIVTEIEALYTLKFHEFRRFRSYLGTASGFQSYQFAGIEALLGRANDRKLQGYQSNPEIQKRLSEILRPVSLWQAIRQHIFLIDDHHGSPMRAVTHVIKKIMESSSCEAILLNQLLDLDCSLQKWRYRHLKLVERTIGQKAGTGGSSGAAYLKTTLFTPIFGELWDAIG